MTKDVIEKYGKSQFKDAPTESEVIRARRWVLGNRAMWATLLLGGGGWWLSTWSLQALAILGMVVLIAVGVLLIISVTATASEYHLVLDKAKKKGVQEDA